MTAIEYLKELRRIQEEIENDIQDGNLNKHEICKIHYVLEDMAEMLEMEIDF